MKRRQADEEHRPHTIFTFIALEQHKKLWRWMHPSEAEEEKVPV